MRSWRSALETIYYHNAYRLPSKYAAKTETEKALQESIRQLEIQCRERVDLLQALHDSRKEAADSEGTRDSGSFLKAKFSSSSKPSSPTTATAASPSTASAQTPGWIGDGTIPAVGYTDLSKPPPMPGRPTPTLPKASPDLLNDDAARSSPVTVAGTRTGTEAGAGAGTPKMGVQSDSSPRTKSRGSSPDKRKPMLTTLRSVDPKTQPKKKTSPKKITPKRKDTRPAASKAAGLAWESTIQPPSAEKAANEALLSSWHSISSDPGLKREMEPRYNSGDEGKRWDEPNDYIPDLHWRVAESSPLSQKARPSIQPVQPQSSPKPPVKPTKPVPLRSSIAPVKSPPAVESDPEPTYTSPRRRPAAPNHAKSTSRTRDGPTPTKKSYRSGDNELDRGMNKMSVSTGSPARRKAPKRSVTPPSSDQESSNNKSSDDEMEDDAIMDAMNRLPKGVDPASARQILNDIVVRGDEVHWDDIAGLDAAKKALKEAVVYPFLRPDLFSGLREPARGMLLFGPPGTGKTMLARAVATESKSTFFSVSASTLTSKWHGESEKLVRALFGLAKTLAPSIIFVDEIDSLLSARSSGAEHEASRRSKTEFLIQWSDLQRAAAGREQSGKDKKEGDASRVLVLAATNMPWDIDEAARRRFVRRQYIPLPEHYVRGQQFRNLLSHQTHELSDDDIEVLVRVTEGMFLPSLGLFV